MVELEKGKFIFKIYNLKVNRIKKGTDEGKYKKPIPVTKSLMKLLIELGMNKKMGTDEYVLDRATDLDYDYIMDAMSRAFGHYIKLVSNRSLQFSDLRKTYYSHLTTVLGDKTKTYTGHADQEVLMNHYLCKVWLAGNLSDFSVF
jgi:integrase